MKILKKNGEQKIGSARFYRALAMATRIYNQDLTFN